jgi:hypothetical protein
MRCEVRAPFHDPAGELRVIGLGYQVDAAAG